MVALVGIVYHGNDGFISSSAAAVSVVHRLADPIPEVGPTAHGPTSADKIDLPLNSVLIEGDCT